MRGLLSPTKVSCTRFKIERRTSGVCGAGSNLNIYERHVRLGDTYEYGRERAWGLVEVELLSGIRERLI